MPADRILKILTDLKAQVGKPVRITAGDDCAECGGIYLNFVGTLEAPESGSNRYYVRVLDNYSGAQGVSFHPDSVAYVVERVNGWQQILLKENLKTGVPLL